MALPATDSFTRADENIDANANWGDIGGGADTGKLVSNRAQTNAVGVDGHNRWTADTFGNDQYAQGKVLACATANSRLVGVIVRGSGSAKTFYSCSVRGPLTSSGVTEIRKVVTGTSSVLSSGTTTVAANDVVKGDVVGTTLTLYLNGSSIRSTTDSAIASGSAGLFIFVDTGLAADAQLDDWEAGNTTAATGKAPPRFQGSALRFVRRF